MTNRGIALLCTFICCFMLATRQAVGQALADKVPDDAVVYVGWSGTTDMGDAYNTSHLKAVLDSTDLSKVATEFIPAIFQKIGQQEKDAKEVGQVFQAVVSPMWHHPTAFYFQGLDFAPHKDPMPKLAVLCDAGPDAPAMVQQIQKAIHDAGRTPVSMAVSEDNGLVRFTVGRLPAVAGTLSDSAAFKAAMTKVHAKPIAAVYVNGVAMLNLIDQAVKQSPDHNADGQHWNDLRQSLGLDGFKCAIWTVAFEDRNWSTRGFIAAPAPRVGLMKALEGQPIPEETIKLIPQTAILAGVGRFDLAGAFDGIKSLVNAVDPSKSQDFDGGVQMVSGMFGVDVRNDLLATIGDTWTYYVDPATGGTGVFGGVVLNKLRDPAKAEKSFSTVESSLNALIKQNMPSPEITVAFKQKTSDGLTLHYLAIPLITPTWTIKDGQWIVGLFPESVIGAADNLSHTDKSILDNSAYVDLQRRLGNVPATSIQFADLPKLAPDAYSSWLLISRYIGIADLFGIDSPLVVMPPMKALQANLSAAGEVSWTTDEGLFMRSVSPFPGSRAIASDPLSAIGIAQPAILTSILLPSLNKARETANRVKCASNLKQIGNGFILYANENKDALPPDLGTLILNEDLTASVFVCPSGNNAVPPDVAAGKPEDQAKWANANSDYVYAKPAKGTFSKLGPEYILAYEKEEAHDGDGMNMLFGDGHVEFRLMDNAQKLIDAQNAANGKLKGGGL